MFFGLKYCSLILLLVVFCKIETRAQIVDLSRNNPLQSIGKAVSYFKDTTAVLGLAEVQHIYEKGNFIKGASDILNFGNTSSAIWVHFSLKSSLNRTDYLVVGSANIEQVDYYIFADGKWNNFKAGSLVTPTPGVRSTSQYIFPVSSSGEQEIKDVWLRVKSRNIILLPLQLARADNLYLVENAADKITELCFVGFLLALLIFHIFLYLSIKDPAYLYYCIYILSLGIYTIGYLGGHSYLLGDAFRFFLYRYPHIFFSIGFGVSIVITNRFYNIRSISLPLFRWTNLLIAGLCILLVVSILGFKAQAALGAQVFGLVVPLTLVLTSVYAYAAERKAILYLGAAWLVFVVAVIFYVLSLQGVIEYRPYSRLILQGGVLLEFMLLAIALGRRYQSILEWQRKVETANFQLIQTHNAELEQRVAKRTEKLKELIVKLKASDEIKNRLFSIVAHDLRTPFNSILGILSSDTIDLFNEQELKLVLRSSSNQFQQLKIMLDNILHWARSQMENVHINKERFELIEMIDLLVAIYRPIAEEKKVGIDIKTPSGSLFCTADKNHIQLVVRNLLDNAVKYTDYPGNIVIEAVKEEGRICFSIQNDFIPADKKHFNERSIGLGIDLCEDYLKRNGASLKEHTTDRLVTYSFELPFSA